MMYNADILLDSINPERVRLTTMRITFPRFVLAELNTHRILSKSAASSRAISVKRRIQQVKDFGFIPEVFGKNQRGMQADGFTDQILSRNAWCDAMAAAVQYATRLDELGVHKQLANRIIEPFCWVTVIISGTDWDNFFKLRISPLAQPEICKIATLMKAALDKSSPRYVNWGEWHRPCGPTNEIAAGRIARVSYENSGTTDAADVELCAKLIQSGHWSPFEHIAQATCLDGNRNFRRGWRQWRAMLDGGTPTTRYI